MVTTWGGSWPASAYVMPGPSTAELNGLNPHVQVEPLTLAIVSLEEELLFEPPPHPATTVIDTAATKISDPKRFIDPPFPYRPSPAESPTESPDAIWQVSKQKEYIVGDAGDQCLNFPHYAKSRACPTSEARHQRAGWFWRCAE